MVSVLKMPKFLRAKFWRVKFWRANFFARTFFARKVLAGIFARTHATSPLLDPLSVLINCYIAYVILYC